MLLNTDKLWAVMKNILFRGYNTIEKQWVPEVLPPPVYPDYMVWQIYSELWTVDGKRIAEGDIVKLRTGSICQLMDTDSQYTAGEVVWMDTGLYVCQKGVGRTELRHFRHCDCCPCDLEIIGNIFDNPELIDLSDKSSSI